MRAQSWVQGLGQPWSLEYLVYELMLPRLLQVQLLSCTFILWMGPNVVRPLCWGGHFLSLRASGQSREVHTSLKKNKNQMYETNNLWYHWQLSTLSCFCCCCTNIATTHLPRNIWQSCVKSLNPRSRSPLWLKAHIYLMGLKATHT